MATPIKQTKSENLGLALQKKAKEMGLNPRRISAEIGYAYDYVRRVYNGEMFPGVKLLKKMCTLLKLDYEEMKALLDFDKILDMDGIEYIITDDAQMVEVKHLWPSLNESDREEIVMLVKAKAARSAKFS